MKKFLAILLISFIACGAGENQKQKPSFWQYMKKSFMSFDWTLFSNNARYFHNKYNI